MSRRPVDDRRAERAPASLGGCRALMLVSASTGRELRDDVAAGRRPCPEYLRLEEQYGIRLVDWTLGRGGRARRTVLRSVRHATSVLDEVREADVVFSDGEHLGIPLGIAMRLRGVRTPHVMIGHHVANPAKTPFFRIARAHDRIDRIIVHSPNQVRLVTAALHIDPAILTVVPYGIDTGFWSPGGDAGADPRLVVAAGREHRDFETLLAACADQADLFVTDSSAHSPRSRRRTPPEWPAAVQHRQVGFVELRERYRRAAVIAVPLVPTAYPFGITSVLEGMATGKPVVVSDTEGLRGIVESGRTGIVVPPGDVEALRDAVAGLLADPDRARRLGAEARRVVVERYSLQTYTEQLANELRLTAAGRRRGDPPA
jgi:glycosyltransferase involved in cell wall biosynthesis